MPIFCASCAVPRAPAVESAGMSHLPWRAFVVGLLLAIGVGYALRPAAEHGAPAAAPVPAASQPAPAASEAVAPAVSPGDTPMAKAGGTLRLDRASFPRSGPVRVSLELPVASADDSPRPVRPVSQPDHPILQING